MSYDELTARLLRKTEQQAARIEQLEAALLTGVCMLSEMGLDPREKCQMAYDYMSAALEKRT